jgi:uncharacterized protein involved in response to NO
MTSPRPLADAALQPVPEPIAIVAMVREQSLSRLLVTYIVTGLVFMLLPGTFLGVWNLISISGAQASNTVAPAWLQAHGHAQIFGWIGSFILGIGFYSVPKLLRRGAFALWRGWTCWGMWTTGVALRWITNVYGWHWRILLPISAALELSAFLLFSTVVSGHRSPGQKKFESWIVLVIGGAVGLLATLVINFGGVTYAGLRGLSVAFPHALDQRFLVLSTWGFMAPFVWGFSARWLPVFLGLRPLRSKLLLAALASNSIGVIAGLTGRFGVCTALLLCGGVAAGNALRLFEPAVQPPKTRGVHASFPAFVHLAYMWLVAAALLGLWAAYAAGETAGIWGASRHAFTVGFIATMVFCVGQRVLPAFSGMRHLFSPRLMFFGLLLLNVGCFLRVSSEVLAYRGYLAGAWKWLPVSAVIEMTAVTLFAVNMVISFVQPAPPTACALETNRHSAISSQQSAKG